VNLILAFGRLLCGVKDFTPKIEFNYIISPLLNFLKTVYHSLFIHATNFNLIIHQNNVL